MFAKMVADKSKFDKVLAVPRGDGDASVSNTNLDSSQSSSSDESLKSKNENEGSSDQSPDRSGKNESGDVTRNVFNSTYICSKPTSVNKDQMDLKTEKDKKYPSLTAVKGAENTLEWKYNSSSYTQNLDITSDIISEMNSDITEWSESKLENLSVRDSLAVMDASDDSVLMKVRKYILDYQEANGTPREEYTFSTLIRVMGQATGRCFLSLFYVILNIAPAVFEIFLHIVRFVLAGIINIRDTENSNQKITKMAVFSAQLLLIYIGLIFIFDFILWPVISMAFDILTKIMLYD